MLIDLKGFSQTQKNPQIGRRHSTTSLTQIQLRKMFEANQSLKNHQKCTKTACIGTFHYRELGPLRHSILLPLVLRKKPSSFRYFSSKLLLTPVFQSSTLFSPNACHLSLSQDYLQLPWRVHL